MTSIPPATPLLPSVSIVTICRNAAGGIERTLRSVAEQDYPVLEHVVIDGASTDGTLAILERHRGRIGHLTSEPDRGIAHAFNKGIAASRGEWLLMLNAGDRLCGHGALRRLATAGEGRRIVSARARCGGRLLPRYRVRPWQGLLLRAHLAHQATLVHRAVYEALGGYDEAFRIRMDLDFFLRALPREPLAVLDDVLAELEPGGVSGTQFDAHWAEGRRALAKNRCGAWTRLQFEAFFLALSLERRLRA